MRKILASVAQIDSNNRPTWLAYNETTGLVETVYCDPITNALYVYGVAPSGNAPITLNVAQIDANDKPTALGYNATSGLTEALRCTDGGALLITIV